MIINSHNKTARLCMDKKISTDYPNSTQTELF